MILIYSIFVRLDIFFKVPQGVQGLFNIISSAIGAVDKVNNAVLYNISVRLIFNTSHFNPGFYLL